MGIFYFLLGGFVLPLLRLPGLLTSMMDTISSLCVYTLRENYTLCEKFTRDIPVGKSTTVHSTLGTQELNVNRQDSGVSTLLSVSVSLSNDLHLMVNFTRMRERESLVLSGSLPVDSVVETRSPSIRLPCGRHPLIQKTC